MPKWMLDIIHWKIVLLELIVIM